MIIHLLMKNTPIIEMIITQIGKIQNMKTSDLKTSTIFKITPYDSRFYM